MKFYITMFFLQDNYIFISTLTITHSFKVLTKRVLIKYFLSAQRTKKAVPYDTAFFRYYEAILYSSRGFLTKELSLYLSKVIAVVR